MIYTNNNIELSRSQDFHGRRWLILTFDAWPNPNPNPNPNCNDLR